MSDIKFTIDGKACSAKAGQTIVEAAKDNGIFIPVLCHFDGMKPAGACRICTVKVDGRNKTACTEPVVEGIEVENNIPELEEMRKSIVEMLFVEGNHMCPVCEKSGNCELQALGYRYTMLIPRFPYLFPNKQINAYTKIMHDQNRCVQCTRCVRDIKTPDGKNVFGVVNRGDHTLVAVDAEAEATLSDDMAMKAMEQCPVGAILKKEVGFIVPIGKRKYDSKPIGSDV